MGWYVLEEPPSEFRVTVRAVVGWLRAHQLWGMLLSRGSGRSFDSIAPHWIYLIDKKKFTTKPIDQEHRDGCELGLPAEIPRKLRSSGVRLVITLTKPEIDTMPPQGKPTLPLHLLKELGAGGKLSPTTQAETLY